MVVRSSPRFGAVLLLTLTASASIAACGSSKGTGSTGFGAHPSTSNGAGNGNGVGGAGGSTSGTNSGGSVGIGGHFAGTSSGAGGGNALDLNVTPTALQTIKVAPGQTTPTIVYDATSQGSPTKVGWSVDRGDAATVTAGPATSTTFAPSGAVGGLVNVIATQNKQTVQRQVFIQLVAPLQNGANAANPAEAQQIASNAAQLTAGGGIGGVGGEGLGGPVSSWPSTVMPAGMGLALLYPYDKTVWPRGMLAPLLQWTWTPGDADAIQIDLNTTSGSFSWSGQFAKPAVIGTPGAPSTFTRHPIPQDVWDMATNTAGGATTNNMPDQLIVSLTVAKGGVAYGPISETWTIAPGRLAGTVYYNSYGTQLVKNSSDKDHNGNEYGAAVLSIKIGSTAPAVVAGPPSPLPTGAGCRVCHVVSGDGSTLIAQHGDNYAVTSVYDLKNNNAETVLPAADNATFGWSALYTDGSLTLTNIAQLAAGQPAATQLYSFPSTPATVPANGLPADLLAGAPAFSPDGKHVSFELLGGTLGTLMGTAQPSQLVSLDFDQSTMSFSNPKLLATLPGGGSIGGGGQNAGFPAYFPTNDAVVFHNQLSNPTGSHRYNTWQGATAQVWWSDVATGTATPLATLNGFDLASKASYLPTGANNHGDDTVLNYEPTTAPVVSGGYAWVVFTSRRLYGSVATTDPWQSDPRGYDVTQYANTTCKKLWVAAVDIGSIQNGMFKEGVTPGTDPSHPAFYLPAQELVAGNARGFWVLDPCLADGSSCMTGDQCCNGFCEPNGPGGALICGPPSSGCSGLQDKCTTAADCCDPNALCINGFCAMSGPQ